MTHNLGDIQIGTDHDTSEFAGDSIRYWWLNYGLELDPQANSILLLCDGGGSNSSRSYLFKEALQTLSNQLNIEIRIAHYPPDTSKYNPIEHRLFPHLTRPCSGVIFDTCSTVKSLMERATTRNGLRVFARIIEGVYDTGKQVAREFKQNLSIIFGEYLPRWNYTVQPQSL